MYNVQLCVSMIAIHNVNLQLTPLQRIVCTFSHLIYYAMQCQPQQFSLAEGGRGRYDATPRFGDLASHASPFVHEAYFELNYVALDNEDDRLFALVICDHFHSAFLWFPSMHMLQSLSCVFEP